MPFPHEAILGLGFFSALVDTFPHHSWPSATRDGEMHQLVLRKKPNPQIASCGKDTFINNPSLISVAFNKNNPVYPYLADFASLSKISLAMFSKFYSSL